MTGKARPRGSAPRARAARLRRWSALPAYVERRAHLDRATRLPGARRTGDPIQAIRYVLAVTAVFLGASATPASAQEAGLSADFAVDLRIPRPTAMPGPCHEAAARWHFFDGAFVTLAVAERLTVGIGWVPGEPFLLALAPRFHRSKARGSSLQRAFTDRWEALHTDSWEIDADVRLTATSLLGTVEMEVGINLHPLRSRRCAGRAYRLAAAIRRPEGESWRTDIRLVSSASRRAISLHPSMAGATKKPARLAQAIRRTLLTTAIDMIDAGRRIRSTARLMIGPRMRTATVLNTEAPSTCRAEYPTFRRKTSAVFSVWTCGLPVAPANARRSTGMAGSGGRTQVPAVPSVLPCRTSPTLL